MNNKFIGICIYCGSKDAPGDEHILPYALGGQSTLQKASCRIHERITSQIIRKLTHGQNSLFGPARSLLGIPTRRKLLEVVDQTVIDTETSKSITLSKPIKEYVDNIFLPILSLPKLEEARFVKQELKSEEAYIIHGNKEKMTPGRTYLHKIKVTKEELALFISLVAYTHAVYERGLEEVWHSPLRKILLGENNDLGTYVGTAHDLLMFEEGKLVSIAYSQILGHLIFRIKFFAWIKETPEYVALIT